MSHKFEKRCEARQSEIREGSVAIPSSQGGVRIQHVVERDKRPNRQRGGLD